MKNYFIIITSLFCSTVLYSQELDSKAFKKVLNEQFSNIVTGQSKTTIGNFASIDLKDAEVSFSGNAITENGLVFGLKGSGGTSDGLYSIFTNSKLNSKISLEGQLHFLTNKPKMLSWYLDSTEDYTTKVKEVNEKYRVKLIEAQNDLEKINLTYKKEKIESDLKKLKDKLDIENGKGEKKDIRIDSLKYAIALQESNLKVTESLLDNYPNTKDVIEEITNSKAKELKKLELNLELDAIKFGWFSVYYKILNNSFKRFYPQESFAEQIDKISFVSHEVRTQYNQYYWTKDNFRSYFFNVGVSFSLTDNFNDLDKKEINEVTNYGANINDRTTTTKYNAYVGDYEKDLKKISIYGDYYRFLFSDNIIAIHLYPEFNFRSTSKPIYNFGFGLMLALRNSKKEDKSIVNAELYYNFTDITNNKENDFRIFERNNIGLRFTFPINFINK